MLRLSKRPKMWPAKPASRSSESGPSPARRRALLLVIPGAMVLLVGIGVLVRHFAMRESTRRNRYPTNEHLAHDPNLSRRVKNIYNEGVEGETYVNRDLSLAITRPDGWELSTGTRAEYGEKYDGLVIKLTPKTDSKKVEFQPIASVVRRAIPPGMGADPVAYIHAVLLKGPKEVVLPPEKVTVNKVEMARVAYEMVEGETRLIVTQYICIWGGAAYTLSVACRREDFEQYKGSFEGVVASFQFGG